MLATPIQFRSYLDYLSDYEWHRFSTKILQDREFIKTCIFALLKLEKFSNNKRYSKYIMDTINNIRFKPVTTTKQWRKYSTLPWPPESLKYNYNNYASTSPLITIHSIPNVILSNAIFIYLKSKDIISCKKVCRRFAEAVFEYPQCITHMIAPKNCYAISFYMNNYGNTLPMCVRISSLRQFSSIEYLKVNAIDMIGYEGDIWKFTKLKSLEIDSANSLRGLESVLYKFHQMFKNKITFDQINMLNINYEWSNLSLSQFFGVINKYHNTNHLKLHDISIRGKSDKNVTRLCLNNLKELTLKKIDGNLTSVLLKHVGHSINTLKMTSDVDLRYFVMDEKSNEKSKLFGHLTSLKYVIKNGNISNNNTDNLYQILRSDNLKRFSVDAAVGIDTENVFFNVIGNKKILMLRISKLVQLKRVANVVNRIKYDQHVKLPQQLEIFCLDEWINDDFAFDIIKQCLLQLIYCIGSQMGRFELILNVSHDLVDQYIESVNNKFKDGIEWQIGANNSNSIIQVRMSNRFKDDMRNVTRAFT